MYLVYFIILLEVFGTLNSKTYLLYRCPLWWRWKSQIFFSYQQLRFALVWCKGLEKALIMWKILWFLSRKLGEGIENVQKIIGLHISFRDQFHRTWNTEKNKVSYLSSAMFVCVVEGERGSACLFFSPNVNSNRQNMDKMKS